MTIQSETITAGPFHGDGVTKVFHYNFKVFWSPFSANNYNVLAFVKDASGSVRQLVAHADYSIGGMIDPNQSGEPVGGYATLTSPLPVGSQLILVGSSPYMQYYHVLNNSAFFAFLLNKAFDNVVTQILQLRADVKRSIKVGWFSDRDPDGLADLLSESAEEILQARDQAVAAAEQAVSAAQTAVNAANQAVPAAAQAVAAAAAAAASAASALASKEAAEAAAALAVPAAAEAAAARDIAVASALAAKASEIAAKASELAAKASEIASESYRNQCLNLVSTLNYGNFRGVWLATETYAAGDCVMHDGAFWLAKQDPPVGVPPTIGAIWDTVETVPKDSPTFTGTPKSPTAPEWDDSEQIATTEWVYRAIVNREPVSAGWSYSFTYDSDGNVAQVDAAYKDGVRKTRDVFTYDTDGNVDTVKIYVSAGGVNYVLLETQTFNYDADGNVTSINRS
jgi:hypothetical protein